MNTRSSAFSPRPAESGAALVITMFFIVIITVMIVGFMDSSRVERSAAQTHFEKMRATTFASQGLEAVVATLRRETADPQKQSGETELSYDQRRRNWTSQPGQLSVPEDPQPGKTVDQKRLVKTVRLFSGKPSSALSDPTLDPILRPPNLNVQTLAEQDPVTYLIDDPAPNEPPVEMKLRWIYQREKPDGDNNYLVLDADGQPAEQPVLDPNNPIVGRFAYWADDESTKVNYNLAWSRESKVGDKNYNKNLPGHQTKIDLRALPSFTDDLAFGLHAAVTGDKYYQTINRFFNTPFDARQTSDPAMRAALDQNKFNLTHYNSDPDTTYYGKARMMLTTQFRDAVLRDEQGKIVLDAKKQPLTRPFLDILKRNPATKEDYIDPGFRSNIDGQKLNKVMTTLIDKYLKRDDWPMVDRVGSNPSSLQSKYYAEYTGKAREQRLAQLALNIIDYVRTAESRKLVVEAIRGLYTPITEPDPAKQTFTADFTDVSITGKEDTYKGLTRGLHITEMGMWVAEKAESAGANKGRYRCYAFIELFLPSNYGIDQVDLLGTPELTVAGQTATKRWQVYFYDLTGGGRSSKYFYRDGKQLNDSDPGNTAHSAFHQIEHRTSLVLPDSADKNSMAFVWNAINDKSKTVIRAGEYKLVALEAWREQSKTARPLVKLRSAVTIDNGLAARVDVAPLGQPPGSGSSPATVDYTLDPGPVGEMQVSSYETTDPRVNGVAKDWKFAAKNSWESVNNAWLAAVGKPTIITKATEPEQDLDKDGKVTFSSLRMPFTAGHPSNLTGRVRSPGDLGLIHTGIEGSSIAPRGGIPWRTLRLQPSKLPTSIVPDWAFMDLFTVPVDVPQKAAVLFAPRGTAIGGRVNMNARPVPFSLERVSPLVAVLQGCRMNATGALMTPDDAKVVATNIYGDDTVGPKRAAATKTLPAGKQYPALKAGAPDVFESPGEVVEIEGVANAGEDSEELVREIANLITARGNVFSVYTIGQALRQTPNGKLLLTGEQRQQAYLERYLVDKGNDDPNDDSIGFRTLYFRNLIP